jgi:protein-tyrosine phosphatase
MLRGAVALVTQPDRVAGYSLMLRSLIDAETPSVIHCSAGKDRTGWGATLLLLLLGVHEATVIEHYLESNKHRANRATAVVAPKVDIELLRPFFEVRSQYARAALDAMHATYGGIESYVRDGLGIADADVTRFRDRMLM